jgi:Na+-transporting NADH:ubiquinone oxidoreductase subunit A
MSKTIQLKKGFHINLAGKAEKNKVDNIQPETFALKPVDFPGISRSKLLVKEGDTVKAGTPILFDRNSESVMYCAPVSGEIAEIVRGDKRKLLEVRILADKTIAYEEFKKYSTSDLQAVKREEAQALMIKSGVWPYIVQRPFGIVASPDDTPKSIFISGFDSHPLAPDYDIIYKGEDNYFQAGIDVLKKFTSGAINLGLNADGEVSGMFAKTKGVVVNKFSGKHPAGNVGVQIHHVDPINKGETVWTVKPEGVIAIGKLFLEGKYMAEKVIALVGSEVQNPQYYKTYSGACITKFVEGNLKSDHVRFVSGNVLTGRKIEKTGYLGFYENMVSVIPEGDFEEFFGWLKPTASKLSFHRAIGLLSFMNSKKEYVLNTNTNGEARTFVMTGELDKVLPMDIYPTYLFKAIMAEVYDEMEALGILELVEEDVALCEFIDVSKHELQQILRKGIDLIING